MSDFVARLRRVPHAPLLLGFAGALPFLIGALLTLAGPPASSLAEAALLVYAGVILSFLGGVHWGVSMATDRPAFSRLGASVLPSLAGWGGILSGVLLGHWALALVTLAAVFLGVLAYDIQMARHGHVPGWWTALRWPLTLTVVASLLLAAIAS